MSLTPADPEHPTTLFVGRAADVRRVQRRIASDPHTRTIVEGNPGVGKTSFVNRIKAVADDLGLVSWNQAVRITQETTLSSTFPVDIRELLRLRIEHLTISGARVTVPIGPEEAAVLYLASSVTHNRSGAEYRGLWLV